MPGIESVLAVLPLLLGTTYPFVLKLLPLVSVRANKLAVRLEKAKRSQR